MENVTIDGKDYPIHFGNAAIAKSKKLAGVSGDIPPGQDYEYTLILIYAGLEQGFRKAKKTFPFKNWEEVADLLDEDPDALEAISKVIESAFPEPGKSKGRAKK